MKSLTEHLWFEVPDRRGFINITPKIEELVHRSGVMEGLCLVNAMHITASVFINDDEPGLHHDYEMWLEKVSDEQYQLELGVDQRWKMAAWSSNRRKQREQRFGFILVCFVPFVVSESAS